ncbi:hypothetical protein AVEN_264312-1 [Araneus ventricosus]|uniref:Uncharacterized protein n=1 Tax=Araneus ventricosus TaxID=182803 RepID=A0A4Y2DST3_ARAVE|nr:hypothetical protein AVEN_264312-1 [Araneus ventricosus]
MWMSTYTTLRKKLECRSPGWTINTARSHSLHQISKWPVGNRARFHFKRKLFPLLAVPLPAHKLEEWRFYCKYRRCQDRAFIFLIEFAKAKFRKPGVQLLAFCSVIYQTVTISSGKRRVQ